MKRLATILLLLSMQTQCAFAALAVYCAAVPDRVPACIDACHRITVGELLAGSAAGDETGRAAPVLHDCHPCHFGHAIAVASGPLAPAVVATSPLVSEGPRRGPVSAAVTRPERPKWAALIRA